MLLTVAFDYSARRAIDAVKRLRSEGVTPTTEIAEHLYLPELRPSTSSCVRRAAGLQLPAVAERGGGDPFTDKPWPDFGEAELDTALALVSAEHQRWSTSPRRRPTAGAGDRPAAAHDRPRRRRHHRRPAISSCRRHRRQGLAYLVPAIESGRVVVAGDEGAAGSAAGKDLPFLAGRCRRRSTGRCSRGATSCACNGCARSDRPAGTGGDGHQDARQIARISRWADSDIGDAAELDWAPSGGVAGGQRRQRRVPRRRPLPDGRPCFAEQAGPSQAAQVVVVNTHLYGVRRQRQGDPAAARARGVRRGHVLEA